MLDLFSIVVVSMTSFVCGLLGAFSIMKRYRLLTKTDRDETRILLATSLNLMQRLEDELNQRDEEVRVKTEAIRDIVYEAHHKGLNPVFKTCRGLIILLRMQNLTPDQEEYVVMLERQILKAEDEEMKKVDSIEHLQV